jgi:hypothetical protein
VPQKSQALFSGNESPFSVPSSPKEGFIFPALFPKRQKTLFDPSILHESNILKTLISRKMCRRFGPQNPHGTAAAKEGMP